VAALIEPLSILLNS